MVCAARILAGKRDWLDLPSDINLSLADERTPLYRRIVDAISGAIESGKLKAGDKPPLTGS
ncbi:MAG: hypothetical protein IPO31_24810 [Candidatus Obscuribacter sp.]|nr:hypothetical protein [Candidatus Obscuribacter sp.]